MKRSRIIGTGGYAPARVVTNDELAARIDTSDEWIATRTGIRQRHLAAEGETTSEMAAHAARRALEAAEISAESLDLIVVGTVTADMQMPACATFLQAHLGARCPAFDVSAACAGSIFALSVADTFIRSGQAKRVLVVGAEMLSRLLDWEDRATCVLFGDGAGAMVLAASDGPRGILSTHLHTDGRTTDILNIPFATPTRPALVSMNGREVYKVAVRSLTEVVEETLRHNGLTASDVDVVVPHQANIRIVDAVLERLGIPREKAILNIDRYGNTSSASVPITLDEGVRGGRIREGHTVLMMAIGGGMTWGSALVRW